MITDRTVFILGAGASNPYGYPTGSGLRKKICLEFIEKFTANYHKPVPDNASKFTKRFYDAGANTSIDLFLARLNSEDRDKFARTAKFAISFFILEAEYGSKFDEYMEYEKRINDWYAPLLNKMMSTLTTHDSYEEFGNNAVTFITFNYDRSLEYYIHKCFGGNFKHLPTDYCNKIGNEIIKIHHVYGKIADLPWQTNRADSFSLNYGYPGFKDYVDNTIENIKTIYEMTEGIKEDIKKNITGAQHIFFLGFGYAKENLEAIGIPEILKDGSRARKIYGTAQGLPENRLKEITNMFAAYTSTKSIHIENTDCLSLLNKYLL